MDWVGWGMYLRRMKEIGPSWEVFGRIFRHSGVFCFEGYFESMTGLAVLSIACHDALSPATEYSFSSD